MSAERPSLFELALTRLGATEEQARSIATDVAVMKRRVPDVVRAVVATLLEPKEPRK